MHIEIEENLSNDEYHSHKYQYFISSSDIKNILKSPKTYFYKRFIEEKKQTPCMLQGSICHKWLLEEDKFFNEYIIAPELNRNTKEYKVWKEQQTKTIISQENLDVAKAMCLAIKDSQTLRTLINAIDYKEVSIFAKDEKLHFKARPDAVIVDQEIIIDYKTVSNEIINPDYYRKVCIYDYGYHVQAAHYLRLCKQAFNLKNPKMIHIVQSKVAPYLCRAFEMSEDLIYFGQEQLEIALNLFEKAYIKKEMNDQIAEQLWSISDFDEGYSEEEILTVLV